MEKYIENAIANRRFFRQIAETGFLEMQTTIEIIKQLKNMGFNVKYGKSIHSKRLGVPSNEELKNHSKHILLDDVDFDTSEIFEGYTGCIAEMISPEKGPSFGFRFDIDALPIHETENIDHIPNKLSFRSKNENTCHACGHDGHIAIGLSLCKYIADNIDNLSGAFRIIFQPAEEEVRGGKSIDGAGATDNLDYMISSHIGLNQPDSTIGVGSIGFLATKKIDITFYGISSHAAANPQLGRNALLGAASLALTLHSFAQYSNGMARINVGTLHSGNARNIIAQNSYMQVEIRGENEIILNDLYDKLNNAVKGTAISYGLEYKIEIVGEAICFETKYPEFTKYINSKLNEIGFKTTLNPRLNASEDVSYLLKSTEDKGGKSIHFLLGTTLKAPHHNEAFDYDEEVLTRGLNLYIKTIHILLNKI